MDADDEAAAAAFENFSNASPDPSAGATTRTSWSHANVRTLAGVPVPRPSVEIGPGFTRSRGRRQPSYAANARRQRSPDAAKIIENGLRLVELGRRPQVRKKEVNFLKVALEDASYYLLHNKHNPGPPAFDPAKRLQNLERGEVNRIWRRANDTARGGGAGTYRPRRGDAAALSLPSRPRRRRDPSLPSLPRRRRVSSPRRPRRRRGL